ncbi:general secretion pathway protein G [Halanaerobium saccharolyticum]|uniref:General secretion pathway protein G n=1 Tax=Halanaerobium saccharolyticum TaxID=43595 RepID=A0A4R6LUB4_9FIRM|nr:prepilin-type N-terminal cleavage/methylation domain-containing protein [Halanaerobium saccharolyticum]TDO92273.1 general secretion pathway protein G [Halanaerobium saccharolyticum]
MRKDAKKCSENFVNHELGFTLIELLIVIVVLGILMSMAVPALSGVKNKADTAVAKADLHNIMQSLEMYYLDHGEYPGQSTKGDLSSISGELEELSIKNEPADYSYQTDTDTGAEKYIIIYEADSDEFYYISTDQSALTGPETTEPTL